MKKDANNPDAEWNSMFIGFLFRMAWPVWKTYNGKVPDDALEQLELCGDWPRGLAAIIMRRISSDAALRKQLEGWR